MIPTDTVMSPSKRHTRPLATAPGTRISQDGDAFGLSVAFLGNDARVEYAIMDVLTVGLKWEVV